MKCKIFFTITAMVFLSLTLGCSFIRKGVHHLDINQGNYFKSNDVSKIHIGMKQDQIIYILGTPLMTDPFGTNTWFYIFYQSSGNKKIKQQNLILTFNNEGILSNINNKLFS